MSLTIAKMNELLAQAGFDIRLTPDICEALLKKQPKQRIVDATVRAASNDQNAIGWLRHLFTGIGGLNRPQASAPQQDSTPIHQEISPKNRTCAPTTIPAHVLTEISSDVQDQSRDYCSVHVYGGRGALCFEADQTRAGEKTIAIDAAPSIATKQYDWKKKLRLQLTTAELPVVTLVLLGKLPGCEFKNHGAQSDKGFSMENQEDKVFVRLFGGNNQGAVAVPVSAVDVFKVLTLLFRQLHEQLPFLQGNDLGLMLHSLSLRMGDR